MRWIEFPDAEVNEKILINTSEISLVQESDNHGRLIMNNGHIINFMRMSYSELARAVRESWT